ncbi:MAG: RNA polymerase sigma factor [Burkholderiales bacterium]|nr:RNA polymerase sigma factor [Burkholderiales bacterium]
MAQDDPSSQNAHALELLARMARGDQSALAAFYRLLAPQVNAFALRQLSDPDEAREVTVDTMHDVWKGAAAFRGDALVRTWVFGIARHKLLDRLRRRPAQRTVDLDEISEILPSEDATPFDEIARRQRAGHVAHCMERLSAEHRECVQLVFFSDLGLAEVASIQNCPENTVKTRLFHARRNLKRCLETRLEGDRDD